MSCLQAYTGNRYRLLVMPSIELIRAIQHLGKNELYSSLVCMRPIKLMSLTRLLGKYGLAKVVGIEEHCCALGAGELTEVLGIDEHLHGFGNAQQDRSCCFNEQKSSLGWTCYKPL